MKAKILRILVLGLFVSLLTVGISDAQPRIKKKIPKRSEYVSLDELHKLWLVPKDFYRTEHEAIGNTPPSALNQRVNAIRHFEMKDYLRWYSSTIEETTDNYVVVAVEHPIIATGEQTRMMFYFDNKFVERIVIEGIGESNEEHIKKGELEVVIQPKKTTIIKSTIYAKDADGNKYSFNENRRIIVVDPKNLNEVMEQAWLKKMNDKTENKKFYNEYLTEIAGGVPDPTFGVVSHNAKMVDWHIKNAKVPEREVILNEMTQEFNEYKLSNDPRSRMGYTTEYKVIARGDSSRIKLVFNKNVVLGIEIRGVGKATEADIANGEYVVTVSPQKTTLFKGVVHTTVKGKSVPAHYRVPAHFRIIVVDPDKYDEVIGMVYKLRKLRGPGLLRQYLNEIAEGVPEW